jgi:hypothetical protein
LVTHCFNQAINSAMSAMFMLINRSASLLVK